MSTPISQFIPPPFPLLVSIPSVSVFLLCKWVPLDHFSRFHVYPLICSICFFPFLTYFTLYDSL